MFLEITDISTGTPVQEPLNAYSINYVYSRQEEGKYKLIYVLTNGIRKIEEFNSQSDLNDRIAEIKEISGGGASANVYTYKGSCTFENLPTSDQVVGDVWNITNDFTLGGKSYPAGTNVAWDGTAWDALAGSIDLSNYYTKAEVDELVASGDFYLGEITDYDANNRLDLTDMEPGTYFIGFSKGYSSSTLAVKATVNGRVCTGDFRFVVQGSAKPAYVLLCITQKLSTVTPTTAGVSFGYSFCECWEENSRLISQSRTYFSVRLGVNNLPAIDNSNGSFVSFNLVTTDKAQTITAKKTFNVLPESSVVPTTDEQLVNKKYVDDNSGMPKFNYDSADPDSDTIQFISDKISNQEDPGMFNVTTLNILDSDTSTNRDLGFGLILMKYDSTNDDIKCTFYGNDGQATFDLGTETNAETGDLELVISNYSNLTETIGDINTILSTLTTPSAVEQALSEI